MPRGVYERKNKANKLVSRGLDLSTATKRQQENCRIVMALQVPDGGAEIKLTNSSDRVIGTVQLTTEGLMMSRPNQKKKPDRMITYVSLAKLMELGLL